MMHLTTLQRMQSVARKTRTATLVTCTSVLLMACGGGSSSSVAAGSALVAVGTEAAGTNCALGGSKITSGLDTNGDGILNTAEVTTTSYTCNGTGFNWVNVAGTSVQAQPNTGYLANNAAQVSVNLPTAPHIGDVVEVNGAGAGGWKLTQNPGQIVQASSVMQNVVFSKPLVPRDVTRNWRSIASSADGSKLVAVAQYDQIYTSADAGLTWTARDAARSWQSVASSADGGKLAAVAFGGQIYTSTDTGLTWTARDVARNWLSVASSADGSKLAAIESAGQIYTSADAGLTWTARDVARGWQSITSSADGSKLAAVTYGGQIYTSADAGLTWTARDVARNWQSVASSSDGNKLVAISTTFGSQVHTSTDAGISWKTANMTELVSFNCSALSADGSALALTGNGSAIYVSASPTSTLGLTGSVAGPQFSAISLQYLGSGVFDILSHEGSDFNVQ
jgi:photosystem II stability/assembly factor-like uncharacterized protein